MSEKHLIPSEPSESARALVLAADARTNVARDLMAGIVVAAQRIEASISEQAGRWVALAEVMAAEKSARPRQYLTWAKTLVADFDDAQKSTFLRDLQRIKTLHAAAQLLAPEKVGALHELIFHRPQEFKATGQDIIIEIGEMLQSKSEADSKHGLFKWASEHSKPATPKRVRAVKPEDKAKRQQAELEALIGDLLGAAHALTLDKMLGVFARFAERDHAAFVAKRREIKDALAELNTKLAAIK